MPLMRLGVRGAERPAVLDAVDRADDITPAGAALGRPQTFTEG